MKRPWTVSVLALLAPIPLLAAYTAQTGQAGPTGPTEETAPITRPASAPVVPDPSELLLHNDPHRDPHAISDALVADIDGVPTGERVDVTTYWLSSARIADALIRADARGVQIRMLFDGSRRSYTPEARRIALAVRDDPGSWVRRTDDAARGDEGIMHEKTFRFSRTGDDRWVVVTGSWNAADTSDTNTYGAMWRVAGHRDIYAAFAAVSSAQRDGVRERRPLREYGGAGWSAYFLPAGHDAESPDPRLDPVLRILRRVPANPESQVRIAMYSMWDARAAWLAAELARISQGGGHVVLVAGPTVDLATRDTVTAAGGRIVNGCYPDGTFIHGKDMALRYVRDGEVRHWTWVGSDNWTSVGMAGDQAALGLTGADAHRQFVAAFAPLARRTDGLGEAECVQRDD